MAKSAHCIEEQETFVHFSRGDEKVKVYTSDTNMIERFDKYVDDPDCPDWVRTKEMYAQNGLLSAKEYEIPKKMVRLLKKLPSSREYTEEEKEALRKRLAEAREHLKNEKELKIENE